MQSLSSAFLAVASHRLEEALAEIEIQAGDRLLSEGWLNHEIYLAVRQSRPDLFCGREPFYTFDFGGDVDRTDVDAGALKGCKFDIYVRDDDGSELFVEAKLLTPASAANADRAAFDADHDRLVKGCNGRRQGLQMLYLHSRGAPLEEQHRWIKERGAWARRSPDFEHRLILGNDTENTFRLLAWAV